MRRAITYIIKMKNLTNILSVVFTLAVLFSACTKEETTAPINNHDDHEYGALALHVNHIFNTDTFKLNQTFNLDGLRLQFNTAKFFLSNFSHEGHHEGMMQMYESVLLVSPATFDYNIGTVAEGHVMHLNFGVGLDSIANHQDPTVAEYPLNDNTMHWGWNPAAGYKFARFEGVFDGNNDQVVDEKDSLYTFVYHIATDALFKQDSVMVHADIEKGKTTTATLTVDYSKLFTGIDITTTSTGHGAAAVNTTIANNMVAFVIN